MPPGGIEGICRVVYRFKFAKEKSRHFGRLIYGAVIPGHSFVIFPQS